MFPSGSASGCLPRNVARFSAPPSSILHCGFASFTQHSLADGRCWPEYVVLQLTAASRTVIDSDSIWACDVQTAAAACIKHRLNGRIVAYKRVCHCTTVQPQDSFRPPRRPCSWSGHWVPEATCMPGQLSRPTARRMNGQRCLVPVPVLPPVSFHDH